MTETFIRNHRLDDTRQLALQASRYPDVDMKYAISQINGWQRARHKLPLWAQTDGIVYPPQVSMEQCSSETTARYKASLCHGRQLLDLTGGFGVDFSYMSRQFDRALYIERQEHLCRLAEHNFGVMGLRNVTVMNLEVDPENLLRLPVEAPAADTTVFLDPARRDSNGAKTYAISDCTPDITLLLPTLRTMAHTIIVKLSPMLDITETLRQVPETTEVHILSVKNECKEVLLVIRTEAEPTDAVAVHCVNDDTVFTTLMARPGSQKTALQSSAPLTELSADDLVGRRLCVPNASVMKAGCFAALCKDFNLEMLDTSTRLAVGITEDGMPEKRPFRTFRITAVTTMNKKELKRCLTGISHANIAVRNFPLSADALRHRLRLQDGGTTFIFGVTLRRKHVLLVAE